MRPHACSSAVARLKRIVALVIAEVTPSLDFSDSLLIDFHVFRRAPFHCQHAAVAHDGSPWTAHCTHHLGRNSMQKAVLYHQCGLNSRRSREGQPQSRRPHSRHTYLSMRAHSARKVARHMRWTVSGRGLRAERLGSITSIYRAATVSRRTLTAASMRPYGETTRSTCRGPV